MKQFLLLLTMTLACLTTGRAAIPVGTNGSGVLTFNATPLAAEFSTGVLIGDGTTYATTAMLDAGVNTLEASNIVRTLPTSATIPPTVFSGGFRHNNNAAGLWIQSRPTTDVTNAANVLLATLQNASNRRIGSVIVTFTMGTNSWVAGELPGFRVYYSLSGAPGTWTLIPALSDIETNGILSATVAVGSWIPNRNLYLLWADDNANLITDPSYTIDNFSVSFASPPTINYAASSLTNRTVEQCRSTTLSVSANGSPPPAYQWFQNGSPISGATAATLTINNAQSFDAGEYHVLVSNSSGATNSTPDTVVSVTPDTTPPFVVSAVGHDLSTVTVVFSEPMVPFNLGNSFNYSLTDTNIGVPLNVISATPANNNTTVILTLDPPRDPAHGYALSFINSFFPDACAGNPLSPTTVPVATFLQPLIALDAATEWRYEQSGTDLGFAWIAPAYNDSSWLAGAGTFDAKRTNASSPLPLCRPVLPTNGEPISTCLMLSNANSTAQIPTIYFRKQFIFNGDPAGAVLRLTTLLDDGAVFYLNGVELTRLGLGNGQIAYNTLAGRTIGDAYYETNDVPAPTLLNVVNTLAVEVHQATLTSSDITFGLLLEKFTATPPPPPSPLPQFAAQPLSQSAPVGGTATFNVTVTGEPPFSYQWHVNCHDIHNATNATLTISNTGFGDLGTYSVTVSNALGQVTSSDAALSLSNVPPPVVHEMFGAPPTTLIVSWMPRDVRLRLQELTDFSGVPPFPWLDSDAPVGRFAPDLGAEVPVSSPQKFFRVASPSVRIINHPLGRSANFGEAVSLSVTATGLPPIRYLWTLNGAVLPGETNATLQVQLDDHAKFGAYQASVTDTNDGLLSRPAVIRQIGTEDVLADNFNDRPLFTTVGGTLHGTTFSATRENGEPLHARLPGGSSVWLAWHAPTQGIVTFDTIGSGFDTLLAAYTGSGFAALNPVTGDDDSADHFWSQIQFNVDPVQDYSIALDGLGGAAGFFTLNWSFTPTGNTLPVIDEQPQDSIINTGAVQQTFFQVAAHGVPPGTPLTYQWFFNTNAIPAAAGGNNPLLNVGSGQPSALLLGVYSVVVSSPTLSVRSRSASLQFSTDPEWRFVTKPLVSSLCGFDPQNPTNCCGGSFANPPHGKPANLLSATSGSVSGTRSYGTTAAGAYTNQYWAWVTNGWSSTRNVKIKATISGANQPCSVVILDDLGSISGTSATGTSPRTNTLHALGSALYAIAVGYSDPNATVTLTYSP